MEHFFYCRCRCYCQMDPTPSAKWMDGFSCVSHSQCVVPVIITMHTNYNFFSFNGMIDNVTNILCQVHRHNIERNGMNGVEKKIENARYENEE